MNAKTFEYKASNRAIGEIFDSDSSDIVFSFDVGGDDLDQQTLEIVAHKRLLSALSPVFKAMFNDIWNETSVKIVDASFDAFKEFIQYFYTDKVTITSDNVVEILSLANKYDIAELVSSCSSFLVENVKFDNVIRCVNIACMFDFDELKAKCMKIIGNNHWRVIEHKSFLQCTKDALFEILSIESSTRREDIIFDNCIKWAQAKYTKEEIDPKNNENIRRALGNCIDRIRMKEMNSLELHKRIELYKDMFTKEEIIDYFYAHTKVQCAERCSEICFEFERCNDRSRNYSCTIKLSHKVRLKYIFAPKQTLHDFIHFRPDQTSLTAVFRRSIENPSDDNRKHWIRRAVIRGVDCFELITPPILSAGEPYDLLFKSFWPCPIFMIKDQIMNGVTLTVTGGARTNISSLHFVKCDEDV